MKRWLPFLVLVPLATAAAHPPELPARCPAGQAVVGFDAEGKLECQSLAELQVARAVQAKTDASAPLATVDEHGRYHLKRSVLEREFADPLKLAREIRVVPRMDQGRVIGMALYSIRRGSLADALGLANGDVLIDVAGHSVGTPADAMLAHAAFMQAQDGEPMIVKIVRGGTIRIRAYIVDPD